MKSNVLFFISLLLHVNQTAFACLNGETIETKNGHWISMRAEGRVPYGNMFPILHDDIDRIVHELDSIYRATGDLDYLSDKGLIFIVAGKYFEAIDIYNEIEKREPGRYSTASNIGTAYELIGDLEKAIYWIKKAVEIDPMSHDGSEWIHVNILEAKLKGESFYTTKNLLNMNFGDGIIPESSLPKSKLVDLRDALIYQLNERMSFIKPKDKIIAQLTFDLGNVAFLLNEYKDAADDYKKAKEYGLTDKLLDQRLAHVTAKVQGIKTISRLQKYKIPLAVGVAALLTLIALVYVYRRNNTIA